MLYEDEAIKCNTGRSPRYTFFLSGDQRTGKMGESRSRGKNVSPRTEPINAVTNSNLFHVIWENLDHQLCTLLAHNCYPSTNRRFQMVQLIANFRKCGLLTTLLIGSAGPESFSPNRLWIQIEEIIPSEKEKPDQSKTTARPESFSS